MQDNKQKVSAAQFWRLKHYHWSIGLSVVLLWTHVWCLGYREGWPRLHTVLIHHDVAISPKTNHESPSRPDHVFLLTFTLTAPVFSPNRLFKCPKSELFNGSACQKIGRVLENSIVLIWFYYGKKGGITWSTDSVTTEKCRNWTRLFHPDRNNLDTAAKSCKYQGSISAV